MLSEIIIEKIALKKVGNMYVGNCPLCQSGTFVVDDVKEKYECFNCKCKGSEKEFHYLTGTPVEPTEIIIDDFKEQVFKVNNEVLAQFIDSLSNEQVQDYIKTRNISSDLINMFDVGFAGTPCWDIINKYPTEILLSTGAFKLKENKVVPMFYNRLMFPIRDVMGNIVGWGGRKIDDASPAPKYINSAENPVYQKRTILFGLDKAKAYSKNGFLICEGYMDVASLHSHGFTNAVAPLGTALTPQQLEMMRYYTDTLYLCYDNDNAGREAIKRALLLARQYSFVIKVVQMTDFKDADEYMQKDKEAFAKCIENAISAEEFIKNNADNYDMSDLLNLLLIA